MVECPVGSGPSLINLKVVLTEAPLGCLLLGLFPSNAAIVPSLLMFQWQ